MKNLLQITNSKPLFAGSPNLLFLLAMALFLGTAACTQTETENRETENTQTEATTENDYDNENVAGPVAAEQVEWNNVDFNIMQDRYDEVDDKDITVSTNQQVAVYSVNEPVLFDKEGNEIRQGAEQKLQQIANSINQRYPNAQIRIYGYGEQQTGNNNDLARKRAEAVQNWLTSNGNIDANRISVHTSGGNQPAAGGAAAGNNTANQDRKVSIAVYRNVSTGELKTDHGNTSDKPAESATGQTGTHEGQGKH